MFFLLRLAFWITLICLLLPSSGENNRRLITSAELTVNDMRGFCQRNPQVCEDVRASMIDLFARIRGGAEVLQTWLAQHESKGAGNESALGSGPAKSEAPQLVTKWQDSLSTSDRQFPWRGPAGF